MLQLNRILYDCNTKPLGLEICHREFWNIYNQKHNGHM